MKGGPATGPSPVDRGRAGGKHHLIVEAHGIPPATTPTGGDRRRPAATGGDVTRLIPLVQAVPPIRGKRGRPLRRPKHLYADRGYDHEAYRDKVRDDIRHVFVTLGRAVIRRRRLRTSLC